MPESIRTLTDRIGRLLQPEFRGRLRARGMARSIIWRAGELPPGAPEFSPELSDDLLDYGHALLAMALRLLAREEAHAYEGSHLRPAFLTAGEALEAAVHHGAPSREQGFHRITAAVAFHLARYAARSFSLLAVTLGTENLSPSERCLAHLLRRSLSQLREAYTGWLLDPANADDTVAQRLEGGVLSADAAIQLVLTTSFMRALAVFEHALDVGAAESARTARELLLEGAAAASTHGFVPSWWLHTMAAHLIGDLWDQSLHACLPLISPTGTNDRWGELRDRYITMLRARDRAEIELWPSQLEAARRATDTGDNLVVALPTSSGKTRIAELCILRALSLEQRVIYVTPLRALSAQVERGLAATFRPLGFSISSLYGASGTTGDFDTLGNTQLVAATPEKLDFALRSHPELLDDVGLVVLDEGHMIGPDEREIRYEALIQRLLRRSDASARRLVCLSALFPETAEFDDFVRWLRRGDEGSAIRSQWRPTRQRFGIVRWLGDHARLDLVVDQETPFVERYIESKLPPPGSRRRTPFPRDKNDLTLATAWRACEEGKQVMVYVPLRTSVETLGRAVIKLREHKCVPSLLKEEHSEAIALPVALGTEWLGTYHPAVECLSHGVALHHGGLPRQFLAEIERLLREGVCRLVIASPTLAQGVNLAASTLIIPSIWRSQKIIRPEEFANVAGRAGRAYVDVDGVILHIVHEPTASRAAWAARNWRALIGAAHAREFLSGILALVSSLIQRIVATHEGLKDADATIKYITSHVAVWDYRSLGDEDDIDEAEWQRRIASLDAAILALVEKTDIPGDQVASALDEVLKGSLWERHLARQNPGVAKASYFLLNQRAQLIWAGSSPAQRRGCYRAGVGLTAGQYLDRHGKELLDHILSAEAAIHDRRRDDAATALGAVSTRLQKVSPFNPRDEVTDVTKVIKGWIAGDSMAQLLSVGGERTSDFVQDGLVYRLTWGLEAVRLWAAANAVPLHDQVTGIAALCCETGTASIPEALLLRAGLESRIAASEAVDAGAGVFTTPQAMHGWLDSEPIRELSRSKSWPSVATHAVWSKFLAARRTSRARPWALASREVAVAWLAAPAPVAAEVRIVRTKDGTWGVFAPDMTRLGSTPGPFREPRIGSIRVRVATQNTLRVDTFAPR